MKRRDIIKALFAGLATLLTTKVVAAPTTNLGERGYVGWRSIHGRTVVNEEWVRKVDCRGGPVTVTAGDHDATVTDMNGIIHHLKKNRSITINDHYIIPVNRHER